MSRYHIECSGRGVGGRICIANEADAKKVCVTLRLFFGGHAVRLYDVLSGAELMPYVEGEPLQAVTCTGNVHAFQRPHLPDPDHFFAS